MKGACAWTRPATAPRQRMRNPSGPLGVQPTSWDPVAGPHCPSQRGRYPQVPPPDACASCHIRACSGAEMWGSATFHSTTSRRRSLTASMSKEPRKLLTSAARATEDHPHEPTRRHLPARHEDPGDRHVDVGITSTRPRPVDDGRASGTHHHVEWMEIQMEETNSTSYRRVLQPGGRGQLMEPMMEVGQHPPQMRYCPGSTAHHCHHVGTLDALDHHVETVFAHFFDRGHGESLASHVLHDASLLEHRTTLPRAPQHQAGTIRKDVRVAARRHEWSGVPHARKGYVMPQRRLRTRQRGLLSSSHRCEWRTSGCRTGLNR